MRRVIVTRPVPQAQSWAARLTQAGCRAQALPLIDIRPVADARAVQQRAAQLADYAAVMFVSAPAVTGFFASNQPPGLVDQAQSAIKTRAWATGAGTRAALLAAGWPGARVDAPDGAAAQFDSEGLWQLVAPTVQAGQRVLVVRGGGPMDAADADPAGQGRSWLSEQLQAQGVQVDWVQAYERHVPVLDAEQRALAQAAAGDGSLWLFSSSEAVRNLQQCLPTQDWSGAVALATHPRIAEAVRHAGFGRVQTCKPLYQDVLHSIECFA